MCLIVFDWRPAAPGTAARLTLAANRDEFFARAAAAMDWWPESPDILAGRDLQGGGTWLGLHRDGRFAALTNYRAPAEKHLGGPTRGKLVSDFLSGPPQAPLAYLAQLDALPRTGPAALRGYNLLVGHLPAGQLAYFSNRSGQPPRLLAPGCYGLSNALLDTPWPKVEAQKSALQACLAQTEASAPVDPEPRLGQSSKPRLEALLAIMQDTQVAPDAALPDTGLTLDWERALSAAYIALPDYGTRCTSALQYRASGQVEVFESGDSSADGTRLGPRSRLSRYAYQVAAT